MAKASGLKTAEAGKVARKGEVNLKAPYALIIEVITKMLYVSMIECLYSHPGNWPSRHMIRSNCSRNIYPHLVSGNFSILPRILCPVFLVYYSGYYVLFSSILPRILCPVFSSILLRRLYHLFTSILLRILSTVFNS